MYKLSFLLALTTAMFAQTAGQISGEVRDPSGALVPDAAVTVTNSATDVSRSTVTNKEGLYSFPDLTPGVYSVKVIAPGFGVMVKANIEIQVQQSLHVDFALTVGSNTQTVEVAANAALLSTENATVGTVIEQQRITDLPLNGRNFWQLVELTPNVTYGFTPAAQAAGREAGSRGALTMAMSGARSTWENYTLDGMTNLDMDFNSYVLQPSVDALQEFKVQSGVYPAEFGWEAGQLNVSTKPGTNQYHLSAWEFLRNDIFDARPYDFASATRSATNPSPSKQPYRQNQFGFTLGGPVRIPKLFNGKNRLFFMANYEEYLSRLTSPQLGTVLTAAMRQGDFSAVPTPLVDPNSRSGTYPNITASPFPNNQIPQARLSPDSVLLESKWMPLPNQPAAPGLPYHNYQFNNKLPVDKYDFTTRIDFNESSKSQWFFRYSWNNESTLSALPTLGLDDGEVLATRAAQWELSNIRTISPTKVNEVRFGYSSLFNNITQQLAGKENVDQELGIPVTISDPNSFGIPNIDFSANNLTSFGNPTSSPFQINDEYFQFVDNFSWVIGKHSLRFGGEFRDSKFPQVGNEFPRGQFYFDTQFTNTITPTSATAATQSGGYAGADFMLGDSYDGIIAVSLASAKFTADEWATYIDDTWRVKPHLTVTMGFRWEVSQPLLDTSGKEPNVDLQQPLPNQADVSNPALQPVYVRTGTGGNFYQGLNFVYEPYWATPNLGTLPSALLPLQTVQDGRLGSRLINTNYKNFAPRVGVAYSPSDKWSIRVGYGIFYSNESKNSIFDLERGLGGRTGATTPTTYGQPTWTYTNFINAAQLPATIPVGLTWGANPHLPTSYTHQWIANVQRTLSNSTMLEVDYTGSASHHLDYLLNENQGILGTQSSVLRLPYPEWGASGIQYLTGDANGNYEGLSAKLTQRYGANLTTLFGYTYARALDDTSNIRGTSNDFSPENSLCPLSCEYGPSDFNIPQRFVMSILYTLPFGKGQRFLNRGGILNEVAGQWQVSTITTLQAGSVVDTSAWDSGGTNFITTANRLNCNAGVNPVLPNNNPQGWFNSAAFSNPLPATFGNCGRNNLRGPWLGNQDISLIKLFPIHEEHTLEFRMEMFNAFNHVELAAPGSVSWGGGSGPTPISTFGYITSTVNAMRQIQFALKYRF